MARIDPTVIYNKRREGYRVIAGCNEGELIFAEEQECADCSHDSLFDLEEFAGPCSGKVEILALSADCKSITKFDIESLTQLIDTNDKVRIDADDPCADYLNDKLHDSRSIKRVVGEEGRCKHLKAEIDEDRVHDILKGNENDCFKCEDLVAPVAKIILSDDHKIIMTEDRQENHRTNGFFFFPTIQGPTNNPGRNDWVKFKELSPSEKFGIKSLTGIEIQVSGWYRVSFGFNADGNRGIHAMRGIVYSNIPDKSIILDVKNFNSGKAGYSANDDAQDPDDVQAASFHSTATYFLPAGTVLMMGCRIDPAVEREPGRGTNTHDALTIIRRAGLSDGHLTGGNVLKNPEAGCFTEVTWVSNRNGSILYK